MKWSMTELRKHRDKPYKFESEINLDSLKEGLQLVDISPIKVQGELTVHSTEIIADIYITGKYVMTCARTLEDVDVPIDIHSIEIFDNSEYEIEYEDNRHEILNGVVDLAPVVSELVVLHKPVRVVKPEADIELKEGNGWEVIDEDLIDEQKPTVDPRFAKLQQLKNSETE